MFKSNRTKTISLSEVPVFYVNLDRQPERDEKMQSLLKEYFNSYHRVAAFDRNEVVLENLENMWVNKDLAMRHGMAIGISHTRALESITSLPALVLEDDVEILEFKNDIVIPKDADILYLGFADSTMVDDVFNFRNSYWDLETEWAKIDKTVGSKDCYKLEGMICCHAILYITERAVSRAKELFTESGETGIPIDILTADLMKELNVYITKRTVFSQAGQADTRQHAEEFNPAPYTKPRSVQVMS